MDARPTVNPRLFGFVGGSHGPWRILESTAIVGEPLSEATFLDIVPGEPPHGPGCSWVLRGVTSHDRYVMRSEKTELVRRQQGLGRPDCTLAALIPIRKKAAWWALTQDERRDVFEAQSEHIGIGMRYLPAVARRLHHCRDLSRAEPFDFLTWFEFSPANASAFDDLLLALRASPEWTYVDREADVRLERAGA